MAASDIPRPGEQALDPVTGPPEGVGEDQAPRPASLCPGDGVSGRLPCPDEVEQEEGKRPGSPAPALPAESRRWARTPACSGAVHGARLCRPLREEQCQPRPASAWLGRGPAPWSGQAPGLHGARSPLPCPRPSRRRLRGARSGRWRSCLVFRSSSQFPRLPALPLDRLQKADSPENGNKPPGHWVAPAGRPLGWAPHLSRRN